MNIENLWMTVWFKLRFYFFRLPNVPLAKMFRYFPRVISLPSSSPSWYPSSYKRLISAMMPDFSRFPSSGKDNFNIDDYLDRTMDHLSLRYIILMSSWVNALSFSRAGLAKLSLPGIFSGHSSGDDGRFSLLSRKLSSVLRNWNKIEIQWLKTANDLASVEIES